MQNLRLEPEEETKASAASVYRAVAQDAHSPEAEQTTPPTSLTHLNAPHRLRPSIPWNNLPEEFITLRGKWFALYTLVVAALAVGGTLGAGYLASQTQQAQLSRMVAAPRAEPSAKTPQELLEEWKLPAMQPSGIGSGSGADLSYAQASGPIPISYADACDFYGRKCGSPRPFRGEPMTMGIGSENGSAQIVSSVQDGVKNSLIFWRNKHNSVTVNLIQSPGRTPQAFVYAEQRN